MASPASTSQRLKRRGSGANFSRVNRLKLVGSPSRKVDATVWEVLGEACCPNRVACWTPVSVVLPEFVQYVHDYFVTSDCHQYDMALVNLVRGVTCIDVGANAQFLCVYELRRVVHSHSNPSMNASLSEYHPRSSSCTRCPSSVYSPSSHWFVSLILCPFQLALLPVLHTLQRGYFRFLPSCEQASPGEHVFVRDPESRLSGASGGADEKIWGCNKVFIPCHTPNGGIRTRRSSNTCDRSGEVQPNYPTNHQSEPTFRFCGV